MMSKKTHSKTLPESAPWYRISAAAKGSAEIFIYGDIGESWWSEETITAKKLVEEMRDLDVENLVVRINSIGGAVNDGIAIYNAIRRHKATTTVEIDGVAYSVAGMIAMAGDTVRMAENALFMVHAPWTYAQGNAEEMRRAASALDKYAEAMASSYARNGVTYEDALGLLQDGDDHYYTAAEAVDYGFVDETTEPLAIAASANFMAEAIQRYGTPDHKFNPAAFAASTKPEKIQMADKANTKAAPAGSKNGSAADNNDSTVTAIQSAAEAKAREKIKVRNTELQTAFSTFLKADHRFCAMATDIYQSALADPDMTVATARKTLLDKIGEQSGTPVGDGHATRATAGEDARDKVKAGISIVLAQRLGIGKDDKTNEFRGMALHQLAAKSLMVAGINSGGMTKSELAGKVLAAHTTSDFPYLLMDAANKKLQAAYSNFPDTWRAIAATGEVTDFKTVNLIRMGSFNSLDTIPEGRPYTQGTISEEREQLTPVTKGKYIQLSRQMIINDDLSGFSRMATLMGRAAGRTLNADVFGLLNANAAMSDGTALFHADHGNLAGSGGAISVASVSAGRAAMRKQTAPGTNATEYLNIMPSVLLTPVVKEDGAREVVESDFNTDTAASRKKNPINAWGPLEVVSDPVLDATSATAWYLIADPMDAPLLEVHFLDGNQEPYLDTNEEFLTDAVQWKVRMDYGFKTNDYRGGYKNAGA